MKKSYLTSIDFLDLLEESALAKYQLNRIQRITQKPITFSFQIVILLKKSKLLSSNCWGWRDICDLSRY